MIPWCRETSGEGEVYARQLACLSCKEWFVCRPGKTYPLCPWCGVVFEGEVPPSRRQEALRAMRAWQASRPRVRPPHWEIVVRREDLKEFKADEFGDWFESKSVAQLFRNELAEQREFGALDEELWGKAKLVLVRVAGAKRTDVLVREV